MINEVIICDDLSDVELINGITYKCFDVYWWEIEVSTGEILGDFGYKLANLTTLH
jgi:hypothetical protein